MFDNKRVFITWWTWTWWEAIINDLLKKYNLKEIIVFSRSEDKQVRLERKLDNPKVTFILGDIRNKELLLKVTKTSDYIIHLAALKHIIKCEENVSESIWINIDGTKNIIDVAIENNISKVLYVSTDKAVEPFNLYWNTKSISEKMIINANKDINNSNTVFFIIRAWNILWSNGSILRVLFDQIVNKKPLTITDLNMRRFYIKINDVIDLIYYSFNHSKWWEIYILKWEVLSLNDILKIMLELYWNWGELIEKIGKRKWEKKDEILISNIEVEDTYVINDKYFVIENLGTISNKTKVKFKEYSTSTNTYNNLSEIKKYIIELFNNYEK